MNESQISEIIVNPTEQKEKFVLTQEVILRWIDQSKRNFPFKYKPNPDGLKNSRPFEPWRGSNHPAIVKVVDHIFSEMEVLPSYRSRFPDRSKKEIEILILDLHACNLSDPSRWIQFSLNDTTYRKGSNFAQLSIKRTIIDRLKNLEELGYVDLIKGVNFTNVRYQSRIKATPKLILMMNNSRSPRSSISRTKPATVPKDDEDRVLVMDAVILRNSDKENIMYQKTQEIDEMRQLLESYNSLLNSTFIDINLTGYSGREYRLDLNRKRVYRIFNNCTDGEISQEGGRYYGSSWQGVPKEIRKRIVFNMDPCIEYDLKAIHPTLLYAMEGIDYFKSVGKDPYHVPGVDNSPKYRSLFKLILLVSLNAGSKDKAAGGVMKQVREEPEQYPPKLKKRMIVSLIGQFASQHAPIQKYFFTGVGIRLQYIDSQIATRVIELLTEKQIPIISIHDSWLAPKGAEGKLVSVIEQAFNETMEEMGIMSVTPKLEKVEWVFRNQFSNDEISSDPELNETFYDQDLQRRYSEWLEAGIQLGCIRVEMD
jgi:hypothetical protein